MSIPAYRELASQHSTLELDRRSGILGEPYFSSRDLGRATTALESIRGTVATGSIVILH